MIHEPAPALTASDHHPDLDGAAALVDPARPPSWAELGAPDGTPAGPHVLRNRLVAIDLVVLITVWTAVVVVARPDSPVAAAVSVVVAVAVTMAALVASQLYRARVGSVRRVARRRLAAAALAAPLVLALTGREPLDHDGTAALLIAGAVLTTLGLVAGRTVFEEWLRSARVRGHHVRALVVCGTCAEVSAIVRLLDAHPEAGCRAVAWVGPAPDGRCVDLAAVPWIGSAADLADAATRTGASGVLVAPSVATSPGFPALATQVQQRAVHVQVSTGLWGIDPGRLRTVPVAHEPCFYLEPARHSTARLRVKRATDVVVAGAVLVLTAPLLALAALAIKLEDRGPVIFRQVRVGRGGELFELHKLRTMAVDAEDRLAELAGQNERSGPLFKVTCDPRVTRVGRLLRATSIDELPQLVDVLTGRLSLVGPRPALPDEVAAFDEDLRSRHRVLPGVTGLWQVEARHNPSFEAYRHLDLFYVENWTLGLDLAILAATAKTVAADGLGALTGRRHRDGADPVLEAVGS